MLAQLILVALFSAAACSLPLVFARAARTDAGSRWRTTGLVFGVVASPFFLGLYGASIVFMHVCKSLAESLTILAVPGVVVGLGLGALHLMPGWQVAETLGWGGDLSIITRTDYLLMLLVNAVVWTIAYGTLGWVVDIADRKRRRYRKALLDEFGDLDYVAPEPVSDEPPRSLLS